MQVESHLISAWLVILTSILESMAAEVLPSLTLEVCSAAAGLGVVVDIASTTSRKLAHLWKLLLHLIV